MTDETEKLTVEQQLARATEHLKYSGETEGVPEFETLKRTNQNFALGREPDAPLYKNEGEAFDAMKARAKERNEEEQASAAEEKQTVDAELRASVQRLRSNADGAPEVQFIRGEQDRLQADIAQWTSEFNQVNARWHQLDPLQQQQLQKAAQESGAALLARKNEFLKLAGQAHHNKAVRAHAAGLAELTNLEPELADKATREDLVKWAAKRHAIPESQARAVTNPTLIANAFREMKAEQAEAASEKRRAEIGDEIQKRHRYRYADSRDGFRSSKDALDSLKNTGRFDDALVYLQARRLEKGKGK